MNRVGRQGWENRLDLPRRRQFQSHDCLHLAKRGTYDIVTSRKGLKRCVSHLPQQQRV